MTMVDGRSIGRRHSFFFSSTHCVGTLFYHYAVDGTVGSYGASTVDHSFIQSLMAWSDLLTSFSLTWSVSKKIFLSSFDDHSSFSAIHTNEAHRRRIQICSLRVTMVAHSDNEWYFSLSKTCLPLTCVTNSIEKAPSFSLFNQFFDNFEDTAQCFNVGSLLDAALQHLLPLELDRWHGKHGP
jgi:hypothetical protein